jgi:hypothetical protein
MTLECCSLLQLSVQQPAVGRELVPLPRIHKQQAAYGKAAAGCRSPGWSQLVIRRRRLLSRRT